MWRETQAILENAQTNFKGKVVLDVGTGSGILALFAAQAGARKVYAVEASDIADCAEKLVAHNNLSHVIEVIKGKVEEIELPEQVDVVISEPMGFLLVHERMLESYVQGRIRFMKKDVPPKMFPSNGTMYFLPFSDWSLYSEQFAKAHFWKNEDFYGVDFTCLEGDALKQYFCQPVVGTFDPSIIISDIDNPASYTIDFETTSIDAMDVIDLDFQFFVTETTLMHGLACWFDVDFVGGTKTVTLTTSPAEPCTHWYQARLMLPRPIAVNIGQSVSGTIHMVANEHFSYTIDLECRLDGTDVVVSNRIQLHDQMYHYLQQPLEPTLDQVGGN